MSSKNEALSFACVDLLSLSRYTPYNAGNAAGEEADEKDPHAPVCVCVFVVLMIFPFLVLLIHVHFVQTLDYDAASLCVL